MKTKCMLMILSLLLVFSVSCSGTDGNGNKDLTGTTSEKISSDRISTSDEETDPNTGGTSAADETEESLSAGNDYLSLKEALDLAYSEAKKWSDAPFLQSIAPYEDSLHYNWTVNNRSFIWTISYRDFEKAQYVQIHIAGGKIDYTNYFDAGTALNVDPGWPKELPQISMSEAYDVMKENGAVYGIIPVTINYDYESSVSEGIPEWVFVYLVPIAPDRTEKHVYAVNAITGEYLGAKYYAEDKKTELQKSELTVKETDLSNVSYMLDQINLVYRFYAYIEDGKGDMALSMLDDYAAGNSATQKMWLEVFNSLKGLDMVFVYKNDEESWTADNQSFEVEISITDETDSAQYGWFSGVNTRFIGIQRYGTEWKIHEIATGY